MEGIKYDTVMIHDAKSDVTSISTLSSNILDTMDRDTPIDSKMEQSGSVPVRKVAKKAIIFS